MIASGATLPLDLADAVRQQAVAAGAETPAVRGADWRLAVVATVNSDGTVVTSDGITARRMDTYVTPAASDLIVITQASNGNWLAWGRGSTGGVAIGETVAARKTASTTRASTTTMANDPHLVVTVSPGTYRLDAFLMYDGDATADLKLGWAGPSGTTGGWWPQALDNSATTLTGVQRWGALSDLTTTTIVVGRIGAGTIVACRPIGTVIIATAGTFALQWAQGTSSATATNLRGQSTLELKRTA